MKISSIILTPLAAALLAAFALPALAYTGQQELAAGAKIGIDAARAAALKAQPGAMADEEIEMEPGGSGLRYSFDINDGTVTHEVGIDAMTGALLENSTEGPNAD